MLPPSPPSSSGRWQLDRRVAAARRVICERLRAICDTPRHFVDLRRGDHRLRPARPCLRRRALPRDADMITFAKGITSGAVPWAASSRAKGSTTPSCAAPSMSPSCPRLYVFGASAGLRHGAGDPRSLSGRELFEQRRGRAVLCQCRDRLEACPACSMSAPSGCSRHRSRLAPDAFGNTPTKP